MILGIRDDWFLTLFYEQRKEYRIALGEAAEDCQMLSPLVHHQIEWRL